MKFSVNWLRELVELPDAVGEVADLLTMAGIEIEEIEERGANIDKVVVAQITASSPHPNADRLSVCQVDDGTGVKRQIVCGAKNYQPGDKVPLALPGAKLPNGTEIRKSKLRGVESEGMLCSPIELGLGDDASGLLILSPEAKVGGAIGELFPPDIILDVEITPNRGDLLSHYGLAREIAALTAKPLRTRSGESLPPVTATATITISAPNECPFFSLRRIENVKVGPSPQWLRARIESVGVRSINNIVDISNFVLLELGQPTHAFDADKLRGDINVRLARDGEKFLALDGKTYSLNSTNLVVADAERAIGIAGVMGGEETGVSETTVNVVLESAYFLPAGVRRTARNLNLPSDASYRFERGIDPAMILVASDRAAGLMRELAEAKPAANVETAGTVPANPPDVSLAYDRCHRLLGIEIEKNTIDDILGRLGLNKTTETRPSQSTQSNKSAGTNGESSSTWQIPSYRRDLRRDVDLIEEVIRAHGVQKIGRDDRSRFTPSSEADREYDWEAALRERLAGYGLAEARTSKLISRHAPAFSSGAIELRNPLSEDHVALRPSLVSGLIDVLGRNVRSGAEKVALFEFGRAFIPPSGKEERHLAILMWGRRNAELDWRSQTSRQLDLFDLKGALEAIIPQLSLRRTTYPDMVLAAEIWMAEQKIGFAGQLAAATTSAPGAVFIAEIHADLLAADAEARKFEDLERFPAITRDIAMIVPDSVTHEQVLRAIEHPREPLLGSVQLFDLFSGGDIGEKRRSLAYRLTYRDRSRTLTGEEVNAAHAKIRERLRHDLGAELRE